MSAPKPRRAHRFEPKPGATGAPASEAGVAAVPPTTAMVLRAFDVTQHCIANATDALAGSNAALFATVDACEKELDELDRRVDEAVTAAVGQAPAAREALACLKLMLDLERIGDLVLSFASRARALEYRIETEDQQQLLRIGAVLEEMVAGARRAFVERDLNRAIIVLRADAEIDRLRNLIFVRHIEGAPGGAGKNAIEVLFMAQALERAGDHARNLAEEVCHFVSGRTLRHVLREQNQSYEQMFLAWLRTRDGRP